MIYETLASVVNFVTLLTIHKTKYGKIRRLWLVSEICDTVEYTYDQIYKTLTSTRNL